MSRTRRRPFATNVDGDGEHFYKRQRAGTERARVRAAIARGNYDDIDHQIVPWDEYDTNRDGKHYDNELTIFYVSGIENSRKVMTYQEAERKAKQLFARHKKTVVFRRGRWGREFNGTTFENI